MQNTLYRRPTFNINCMQVFYTLLAYLIFGSMFQLVFYGNAPMDLFSTWFHIVGWPIVVLWLSIKLFVAITIFVVLCAMLYEVADRISNKPFE